METNNSDFDEFTDKLINANSDKFEKNEKGGPLFFEVTFFKKFETLRNPNTGKIMDLDMISCFEFPQFACLFEPDTVMKNDSWRSDILEEFVEYLKIKSAAFARMIIETKPIWIDDVTVRFSVATAS